MNGNKFDTFALTISSDPQYPWYDAILPPKLTTENQVKDNSYRQITEQYNDMNSLAKERRDTGSQFLIEGNILNGDLTAFGHDWQYEKYIELYGTLQEKQYPGLGNHDYSNNVGDSYNDNCATRMVMFMYDWLKSNVGILSFDFTDRSYYKGVELRTDFEGSLSYSFNIGKVHIVQLQNYPSYVREWNSWNAGSARRDFFYIREASYWLKNDLAIARNRGDIIIVNLHDYHDNFIEPGLSTFNNIVTEYGVSAVFAGHIHQDCGLVDNTSIPFFRSGAASYQDYLVVDINTKSKEMVVRKRACPEGGRYSFTEEPWKVTLDDTLPNPPLPIPPLMGHVTFFNEGGFVARFELSYTIGDEEKLQETGNMALGDKKHYDIPPDATNIRLKGEEDTALVWEGWRTVFDLRYGTPPNKCFKLYNTTLDPKWNNDCK